MTTWVHTSQYVLASNSPNSRQAVLRFYSMDFSGVDEQSSSDLENDNEDRKHEDTTEDRSIERG